MAAEMTATQKAELEAIAATLDFNVPAFIAWCQKWGPKLLPDGQDIVNAVTELIAVFKA